MKGDFHVRFLERLGLKCSCLLDSSVTNVQNSKHRHKDGVNSEVKNATVRSKPTAWIKA